MQDSLTQEDIEILLQDQQVRQTIFQEMNKEISDSNAIDSVYRLKQFIIALEKQTHGVITKDIILANLNKTDDKQNVNRLLSLASKFAEMGVTAPAEYFSRRAHIIAGVSRGVEGFQQVKMNEAREDRKVTIEGLKETSNLFGSKIKR